MTRLPVMSVANDARAIARQLIDAHHVHLLEADILYVFTDQRRKRCDRVRLGSAAKLSALQQFLASGLDGIDQGPDFVILLDSTLWEELPATSRSALVDHELCHCALFVSELAEAPRTWRRFDLYAAVQATPGVDCVADAALVSRRTLDSLLYRQPRVAHEAVAPVSTVREKKRKQWKGGPKR